MCLIGVGFIICLAASGRGVPGVVYFGVFVAVVGGYPPISTLSIIDTDTSVFSGIYPAFPGNITWLSNNLAGSYKRAVGMAVHIGAGNLAGGELLNLLYLSIQTVSRT